MNDLTGQVVAITGASRGVGRGLALAFASAGASVVLAVRSVDAGEAVRRELATEGLVVRCDVTDRRQVDAMVDAALDRFGRLDHLVHNATSGRSSEVTTFADAERSLFDEHASVSLVGLQHLAQAASTPLRDARGSLIVLTSPAGFEGSDTVALYAAVKGAQRGFVRSLAREWGPHGVRVNALAPLAVSDALADAFRENPALQGRLEGATPLGRIGDPEADIGPVAVFLASDAASYVTGQTLVVSGGRFTSL